MRLTSHGYSAGGGKRKQESRLPGPEEPGSVKARPREMEGEATFQPPQSTARAHVGTGQNGLREREGVSAGFRLLAAELGGQEEDHTGKEARKRVQEKEDRRKRRVFPLTPRLRGCPARHQQPVSTGVWGQESSPSCTSTLRGQQSRGKHTKRPGVSAENQIIKWNEMKFHNRKQELKRETLAGPVSGRETQQEEAISLQTNFKNLHSLKTEILKKNDENLMTS